MSDINREPCPDRILDDVGGAFGMGAIGGTVYHFISGLKNSPRGERLLGGAQAVQINAPRLGGSFAVWGGLFSTFDCTLVYVRQREDPWNAIAAGFLTGGFLQLRAGPRSALSSAVFGGVLLAMIEGVGIMLNRLGPPPPQEDVNRVQLPSSSPFGLNAGASGAPQISSSSDLSLGGAAGGSSSSESSSWSSMFPFFKGDENAVTTSPSEKLLDVDSNPPPVPDFAPKEESWFKFKS